MLGPMAWLGGNLSVRLRAELPDARSVVARLNESGGRVSARIDGEHVVIRPRAQPTVAGMPVYYSGRPSFRGKVHATGDGQAALTGWLDESFVGAVVFLLGAGAFAAFGGLLGVALVVSGDPRGLALLAVVAVTGVGLVAGAGLSIRMSNRDRATLMAAIRSLELEE